MTLPIFWFESPYVHEKLSTAATLRYASYCMSQIALQEECNVMCPHMVYGNLPKKLFEGTQENTEISDRCKSLATSWYPGKIPVWRDYSALRKQCDEIYVCVDLGVTRGMQRVIDENVKETTQLSIGEYLIQCLPTLEGRDAVDEELLQYLHERQINDGDLS